MKCLTKVDGVRMSKVIINTGYFVLLIPEKRFSKRRKYMSKFTINLELVLVNGIDNIFTSKKRNFS